jgi:predicted MFS family arabinose efflux permease
VGVLAGPIKADLALSDTQLGLMGGLAFALLYSIGGLPLAWLADRWSRARVIMISLTVWSAFTGLCGFARSSGQLFLMRMGVGVGEAGGLAPSYALVADFYPPEQRARAIAVFYFGMPFGTCAGVLMGAFVAHRVGWRAAFTVAGCMGLAFVPVFALLVRDPRPRDKASASHAEWREALRGLLKLPSFWYASMAAVFSSLVLNGVIFWLPSFLQRTYQLGLLKRSAIFAGLMFFGGLAGLWLGGSLVDHFGRANKSMYALIPGIIAVLLIPCFLLGLTATNIVIAVPLLLIPLILSFCYAPAIGTIIQHLAPAPARATASSVFLLLNAVLAIGLSVSLFGFLSDHLTLRYGAMALKYSIICCLAFYILSAALFFMAARYLPRDWID